MYVHLGRDYVLNDRDIIGIFNLETTTISPRGREFLNYAQKNGAVVSLSDELPQSYVLALLIRSSRISHDRHKENRR